MDNSRNIKVFGWFLIFALCSCDSTDYDFGPIHNHPPYLEIKNEYEDGILNVLNKADKYVRFSDTIDFGEELVLPVEPDSFKIYFIDLDSVASLDTLYLKVRKKDKHIKISIPW